MTGVPINRGGQLVAVIENELSRFMTGRGVLTPILLAAIPVMLACVIAMVDRNGEPLAGSIDGARRIYSIIYSGFVLSGVVFLGSAAVFTTLFRGEILARSMHYYLLCPIRREIVVFGKFISGLVLATILFGLATALSYLVMYLPFGLSQLTVDLADGVVFVQLASYLGVTILGCIGYGSIFLVAGLLFRNPLLPVVFVAGWELIHFLLPPVLKSFSVVYYLKGLLPMPLDEGPLAVVVESPSIRVSLFSLLLICLACIAIATVVLRRIELAYADD